MQLALQKENSDKLVANIAFVALLSHGLITRFDLANMADNGERGNHGLRVRGRSEPTQTKLGAEATRARRAFEAHRYLSGGKNNMIAVRRLNVSSNQTAAANGVDTTANPVDYILAALGSCQEMTYRLCADALGIPLKSVSVELTAAIDLQGFLNVGSSVRPGCQKVEARVVLDSSASDMDLARLKGVVDSHCPVLDMLRNPTPVELSLRKAKS
jgi:putative redox protein